MTSTNIVLSDDLLIEYPELDGLEVPIAEKVAIHFIYSNIQEYRRIIALISAGELTSKPPLSFESIEVRLFDLERSESGKKFPRFITAERKKMRAQKEKVKRLESEHVDKVPQPLKEYSHIVSINGVEYKVINSAAPHNLNVSVREAKHDGFVGNMSLGTDSSWEVSRYNPVTNETSKTERFAHYMDAVQLLISKKIEFHKQEGAKEDNMYRNWVESAREIDAKVGVRRGLTSHVAEAIRKSGSRLCNSLEYIGTSEQELQQLESDLMKHSIASALHDLRFGSVFYSSKNGRRILLELVDKHLKSEGKKPEDIGTTQQELDSFRETHEEPPQVNP